MSRAVQLTIFLSIVSVVLFIVNRVIYEALAVVFLLSGGQLVVLAVLLGIFSTSFIAATILGTHYYNWFSRWFYRLAALWLGVSVYLFLASLVFGLLVLLPGVPVLVGGVLLTLAVLVSVYGVFHARRIQVAEVFVALPNLPAAWRGRRAVWVSDLHLGQLHGPRFAQKVVRAINAVPHDLVFIGGDLFDGTGAPDIIELVAPLKELHAPLGVYFITGNHEEFGERERFASAVRATGVRTLMDERVDIDGLQLVGVDYKNASDAERFKRILSEFSLDRDRPSILLKHEPKDLAVAQEAGVSLQVSGHTHRAQQWPLEYVARLTYKGFAYGLKRFKTMQVYVSSGIGTWGPPLRVGTDSELVVFVFG